MTTHTEPTPTPISQQDSLEVRKLYSFFKKTMELKILAGEAGLGRQIRSAEITRPGLAFAGFFDIFSYDRTQLIGNTETGYLSIQSQETRARHLKRMLSHDIPCFLVTNNNELPADMLDMCIANNLPVLQTPMPSTRVASMLIPFLEEHFAPTTTAHGELLKVFGVGCMITGESGVGKSECALDLVERGHSLIADDLIYVTTPRPNELYGSGNKTMKHNMEIRGLGILDIQKFFGMVACGERTKVDLIVKLDHWKEDAIYDRTGLETKTEPILGVQIPFYEIPVKPGRNVPMLVEMACLTQRMKDRGENPAAILQQRIAMTMNR